jgi:HSP20 family protein
MFALAPWRKERRGRELLPRGERFRLFNELESLFEPLFRWPLAPEEVEVPWGITAEETEKEVVFRAELPGFELAEVAVWVSGEVLTMEARHEEPAPKEKEKEPKAEARFAHVRRAITLPPTVNPEKAEAAYRNGVLEVRFPKVPEVLGRRIEVKT